MDFTQIPIWVWLFVLACQFFEAAKLKKEFNAKLAAFDERLYKMECKLDYLVQEAKDAYDDEHEDGKEVPLKKEQS